MKKTALICLVILISQVITAQEIEENTGQNDANAVAKKLADPNAVLGSFAFPIDYINYNGSLPDASSQNAFKLSFQPSLPYPLGPGTNLFLRPLIPIIVSQPVFNGSGFNNVGVELGDIGFDLAIGHTWPSKWLTLVGIAGSAPSATLATLSARQWTLGPELVVGKTTKWGFFGLLAAQSWGLSGAPDKDLSITGGQYFYTINLKNAWQIQAQPLYSYNHNGSSGNKLTLPLGTGVAKTIIAGKMPLKFSLQYWYYIESPDNFGPEHQIRFSIIPVIPLPW